METRCVGKSVPRLDGRDKVTGRAVYSVDVEMLGMLHGAVLRSPHASARIVEIDCAEARRSPGVRVVITGKDVPYTFGSTIKDQPFLACDRIRFVGEPVAAAAAETERQAQEALAKIRVRYEELPAVFDPREALREGAPILHPALGDYTRASQYEVVPGTNICMIRRYSLGDVDAGFREADEVFADEFAIHAVAHTPMETHAAVARYSPLGDDLTVWSATDGLHRRAKELADSLGLSLNQVRCVAATSGGGFGGKGTLVAEVIAVALAKFAAGRPVRVVYSREEELAASQTRHGAFLRLKTGMRRDGTFTARQADIVWDKGAYASKGIDVAYRGMLTVVGPYRIPNVELLSRAVYTNKQAGGAYRGFGTTQVTWACESQLDIIAARLGIDPLELRLKNAYVDGDRYINGQLLTRVGLGETLRTAGRAIGWDRPRPEPRGPKVRGRGIASVIKPTATPTDSSCLLKMNQDGSVSLFSAAVEVGGGQTTVLAQIAADAIGVPLAAISVPAADTAVVPYDSGVTSSRITFHMGNAVRKAGEEVRRRILAIAAELFKTDPGCLALAEGVVSGEGVTAPLTIKALLEKKYPRGCTLMAEGHYSPAGSSLLAAMPGRERLSSIFWMFATHAIEVEVDRETGVVKVLKVAAAHDVGRAINPQLCEQQIEGAVVMGLSNTLFEEFQMEKGRVLNDNLADYKLATMMDLPEIETFLIETDHEEGPFGAKGVGEPAAAPTAPAIANAVYDAIGVRIRELPITPQKILAALKGREGACRTG